VRALFAKKVRFARAEQLWKIPSIWGSK